MIYLCLILLQNVLYYYYCIPAIDIWHISVFGELRDSPRSTTLLRDFSHPVFLWCFQMERIILDIDMEVAFELDVINNRIILYIVDRVLTITVIND